MWQAVRQRSRRNQAMSDGWIEFGPAQSVRQLQGDIHFTGCLASFCQAKSFVLSLSDDLTRSVDPGRFQFMFRSCRTPEKLSTRRVKPSQDLHKSGLETSILRDTFSISVHIRYCRSCSKCLKAEVRQHIALLEVSLLVAENLISDKQKHDITNNYGIRSIWLRFWRTSSLSCYHSCTWIQYVFRTIFTQLYSQGLNQ